MDEIVGGNSGAEEIRARLAALGARAKTDLLDFAHYIMGFDEIRPRGGCPCHGQPGTSLHADIAAILESPKRKTKSLILCPRGHFKTSLVTEAWTVQRIVDNPNIRILVGNATLDNARAFLGVIKKALAGQLAGGLFTACYGSFQSPQWRQDDITVAQRTDFGKKEATVTVTAMGANVVSQHYDLIIMDDIVCRENVGTPEQMKKAVTWYKDALDLLDPGGEIVVIGTRWHDADLYGWILGGGDAESRQSISEWEVLIREACDDNFENVLFPLRFDREELVRRYIQQGPYHFNAQYRNNAMPDSERVFPAPKRWIELPKIMNQVMFCDPSVGKGPDSDYTAIDVAGMDNLANLYVMDYVRRRMGPFEIVDELYRVYKKWDELNYRPQVVGIEKVGFQTWLADIVQARARETGVFLPIQEVSIGPTQRKSERIEGRLQPRAMNGALWIGQDMPDIEQELARWPFCKHDDLLDALASASELLSPAPKAPVHYSDYSFAGFADRRRRVRGASGFIGNEYVAGKMRLYT